MADIRALIILSPTLLDSKPETPWMRRFADAKMMVRRLVVRSARLQIFRTLYRGVYRAHLWVAAELGKHFSGTTAVYLVSGMSTGDVNLGISDVDVAIFGEWPEKRQFLLMKIFGAMALFSPLFDQRSLASICTLDDVIRLCDTDMFMALNHAKGKLQWKLLAGDNVLAALPDISPERFAGCVYMDVRRWWSSMSSITFGDDVMARDDVFRNSICFKAVAEMLRSEKMLQHGIDLTKRGRLIEQEALRTQEPTLQLLQETAEGSFLQTRQDVRPATMRWFLAHAERFHAEIRDKAIFAATGPALVLGEAEERLIAPETLLHAQDLIAIAQKQWQGLRAAYLIPCISMLSPDSLALVLEVEPDQWSPEELSLLCRRHLAANATLPQRLMLFVLLPNAAYQLDGSGSLDFFHYTLFPEANPDVFASLSQPGSLLYGSPRPTPESCSWTAFAQELILEELEARREAYVRFGLVSRPTALENLRNLWRFLQLLVVEKTTLTPRVELPVTLPAVRRCLLQWNAETQQDLLILEAAHRAALAGQAYEMSESNAAMQRVYDAFRTLA